MISQKHSIADYTCAEFRSVVEELLQATGTSAWQDRLLEHFIDVASTQRALTSSTTRQTNWRATLWQ